MHVLLACCSDFQELSAVFDWGAAWLGRNLVITATQRRAWRTWKEWKAPWLINHQTFEGSTHSKAGDCYPHETWIAELVPSKRLTTLWYVIRVIHEPHPWERANFGFVDSSLVFVEGHQGKSAQAGNLEGVEAVDDLVCKERCEISAVPSQKAIQTL